MSSNLQKLP